MRLDLHLQACRATAVPVRVGGHMSQHLRHERIQPQVHMLECICKPLQAMQKRTEGMLPLSHFCKKSQSLHGRPTSMFQK